MPPHCTFLIKEDRDLVAFCDFASNGTREGNRTSLRKGVLPQVSPLGKNHKRTNVQSPYPRMNALVMPKVYKTESDFYLPK